MKRTNKKKTTEEFIEDARKVHGDKYDYSKVDYVNAKTKVFITCPQHGDFEQAPSNHLWNKGCPTCGKIKNAKGKSKFHLKNKDWDFEQPEDYKLMPTSSGQIVKVSNESFNLIKDINWSISPQGYATNKKAGLMHRLIVDAPDNKLVDHRNGDKLDNRLSNLRLCNFQNNNHNSKPHRGRKYKGTHYSHRLKKYRSAIHNNYVLYRLGWFKTEEEAARAYDKKAIELFGEFARLNNV